ncbi:MAG: CYTH domain-containing protein [Phycisphaerae bacterium]|nr:CYTH domain-containing protein [Phycisphaerae bacterium]
MQNVEVKHELREPDLCRSIIARLGARLAATLRQRDTYFRVPDGRLKKREVEGEGTEWIMYHRQNRPAPRLSHFTIYTEQEALARFGLRPLPVWVIVEKSREVWLMNEVRLHIDEVERLGRFFEIEALVTPRRHVGLCREEVDRIVTELGPMVLGEVIAVSYSDMMAAEID